MPKQVAVLVVDDDEEILGAACLRLRAAGFHTLTAGDGEAGLAAAVAHRPDAILLDVRLPQRDGLTVLAELKGNPATKNIPVVMLSASVVDQEAALDAGARFFLRKPYCGEKLVQAVRTSLGSNSARLHHVLHQNKGAESRDAPAGLIGGTLPWDLPPLTSGRRRSARSGGHESMPTRHCGVQP